MAFELTAAEEQRVADLMEAFGWSDFAARQQAMFEAGYPVICDLIPIDAACVVCGQPFGRGDVE